MRFAGGMGAVGTGIERLDFDGDAGRVRECYEIFGAVQAADDPDGPPIGRKMFEGWLKWDWSGDPREVWVLAGEAGGRVDGFSVIQLPSRDNQHLGFVQITVRQDRRRRGLGTALLRHAAGRAVADGREVLSGYTQQDSAGEAFARSLGATTGGAEIRRVLDLTTVPADRFSRLRAAAEAASAGYSLTSWTPPTPEEYLDQVAAINAAIADAPHDPSWQPPHWDAARVRDTEDRIRRQRTRAYTVAARHDASAELAGFTQVEVSPEEPDWAFQGLTAVIRAHRGHRLGMLLKTAIHELLAEAEPQLKRVVTGNSETNDHMIAINEALGYQILGPTVRFWELPAAGPGA
jgi:GNAT superfamily N-acetyltransferase